MLLIPSNHLTEVGDVLQSQTADMGETLLHKRFLDASAIGVHAGLPLAQGAVQTAVSEVDDGEARGLLRSPL